MRTSIHIPTELETAWEAARQEARRRSYEEAKNISIAEVLLAPYKPQTKGYTHIVRNKTNGIALSRHKSKEAAHKAAAKETTDMQPLEVIDYSETYWKDMK